MTRTEQPRDLYELLGVRPDATAGEITRAWHRRARALHPDAQPGQPGTADGFRELEAAYRILHDPALRAAYDQELRLSAAPPAPAARPPGWAAVSRRPAARPPGAALWAGPAQVSPPPGSALPGGQDDGRLAALALLLARQLAPAPGWDWPW
jgi:curved DNA-binding protein CbpA